MKRLLMTMGILSMLVFLTCSRSVEGETTAWSTNKTKVNELITWYPGLKIPLQEKLKSAESAWSNTSSISGEEQKIEAMAEANRILTSDFVGKLKKYDRDKKKLQDLVIDAQRVGKDESDRASARSARSQADDAIRKAESRLRQGASTIAAANTMMNRIDGDFKAASRSLKKVISFAKDKQKKEKKDKADQQDRDNEAKKALTWKCSYCGKINKSHKHECSGCGAAQGS